MDTVLSARFNRITFEMMKHFSGQHSFWIERGGYARVAVADQSIIDRDGNFAQPQTADHGLLFVDFHTIAEKKYELEEHRITPCSDKCWLLPVVDKDGKKFSTLIDKREYKWFMNKYSSQKV